MFHMLDTYGFKKRAEQAKQDFIRKFPNSDFAKELTKNDKKVGKTTRLSGTGSLLNPDYNKAAINNPMGVISE